MPIPNWLLDFRQNHGRDPKPSELTETQRRDLNQCIKESREFYPPRVIEAMEAVVGLRDTDPYDKADNDKIFERLQREFMHYAPMMQAHWDWVRKHEPDSINLFIDEMLAGFLSIMDIPSEPGKKSPKSMAAARSLVMEIARTSKVQKGKDE